MSNHIPHFPIGILTHNGQLITAAAVANPAIAARLPVNYTADAIAALALVTTDVGARKMPTANSATSRPPSTPRWTLCKTA